MNEYEQQRLELIARNRARLLALGIPALKAQLATGEATQHRPAPAKKRHAPSHAAAAPVGVRRSGRLSGRTDEDAAAVAASAASELASFIIDGECPRCGKVLSRGHARHLEFCSLSRARSAAAEDEGEEDEDGGSEEGAHKRRKKVELTEEELAKARAEGKEKEVVKLSELELSGLVDFSEEMAKFAVVGSTGNHYVVTLSDKKRSCECVDQRIRKHDCKHIRLILRDLGVADKPSDWKEGLRTMISRSAEGAAARDAVGTADDGIPAVITRVEAPVRRGKKAKKGGKQRGGGDAAATTQHDDATGVAADAAENASEAVAEPPSGELAEHHVPRLNAAKEKTKNVALAFM